MPKFLSPDERRRHRRFNVDGVRGSLKVSMDASVLNLSLTGIAIETPTKLTPGTEYALRLPTGDEPLSLPVEARWCNLARTIKRPNGDVVPIYRVGLRFAEVLTEQARELLSFMEDHIVVEPQTRVFGRFSVSSVEPVNLEEQRSFAVRRLSMSGMLIESAVELGIDSRFDLNFKPGDVAIDTQGRVTYVRPTPEAADRWLIGVQFLDMSETETDKLEAFIETLIE